MICSEDPALFSSPDYKYYSPRNAFKGFPRGKLIIRARFTWIQSRRQTIILSTSTEQIFVSCAYLGLDLCLEEISDPCINHRGKSRPYRGIFPTVTPDPEIDEQYKNQPLVGERLHSSLLASNRDTIIQNYEIEYSLDIRGKAALENYHENKPRHLPCVQLPEKDLPNIILAKRSQK